MYMIYTDKEMEDKWRVAGIPFDLVGRREVEHLRTIAEAAAYAEYVKGGPMVGLWREMKHRIEYAASDDDVWFRLQVSSDYFKDRKALRVLVLRDGEVHISFGGWMDLSVTEHYQAVFREWLAGLSMRAPGWLRDRENKEECDE